MSPTNTLFFIDWLTISGKLSDPNTLSLPSNFKLEMATKGTPIFEKKATIKRSGKEIGTLFWGPRQKHIEETFCQLKIANARLYEIGLKELLQTVPEMMGISERKISRIDLALDVLTPEKNAEVEKFVNDIAAGKKIIIGNSVVDMATTSLMKNGWTYLRKGKRSSISCLYVYRKDIEISLKKEKSYIKEIWQKCGWKEGSPVWRFELSVNDTKATFVSTSSAEIKTLQDLLIMPEPDLAQMTKAVIKEKLKFRKGNTTGRSARKTFTPDFFGDTEETIRLQRISEKKTNKFLIAVRNRVEKTIQKMAEDPFAPAPTDPDYLRALLNAVGQE